MSFFFTKRNNHHHNGQKDIPRCSVCGEVLWGKDQTDFGLCWKHLPSGMIQEWETRTHHDSREEYQRYIRSPEWKQKARAAKKRAGYRCQVCNRPGNDSTLEAHHRTYNNFRDECEDDITVLCHDCHSTLHYNIRGRGGRII